MINKILKVGDIVPNFSLPDQDNQLVSLSDFDKNHILIYFYPKAMTPGCTIQACNLRDNIEEIKSLGIKEIIGISTDKPEKLLLFFEKEILNFILLSDQSREVCKKFGVWKEKKFMNKLYFGINRSSFIINQNRVIEKVFDNFKVHEHHNIIINYLKSKK